MIDAAIVLPLVILAVMAMIYLLINIYSTVSLQLHMHLLLREESGVKSGMVKYEITDDYKRDKIRSKAESARIDIKQKRNVLSKYVEANKYTEYTGNMLIKNPPKIKSYGRSYINNESDIVRFKEIVTKD